MWKELFDYGSRFPSRCLSQLRSHIHHCALYAFAISGKVASTLIHLERLTSRNVDKIHFMKGRRQTLGLHLTALIPSNETTYGPHTHKSVNQKYVWKVQLHTAWFLNFLIRFSKCLASFPSSRSSAIIRRLIRRGVTGESVALAEMPNKSWNYLSTTKHSSVS